MTQTALLYGDRAPSVQVPGVMAAAERTLTRALESCARQMDLRDRQAAADRVRRGDVVARMYCRTSTAQQLAESLGEAEAHVRAIYGLDNDVLFEDLCSEGHVHLVVWTCRKTAHLVALVAAWERALARACSETIGSHGSAPLLDVQIIDDADVEKLLGCGRNAGTAARLAVYWMRTANQVVDILYERTRAASSRRRGSDRRTNHGNLAAPAR